ncbi:hypothetical protein JCM8097_000369 [Rhodosporidiobolus ruineniae]
MASSAASASSSTPGCPWPAGSPSSVALPLPPTSSSPDSPSSSSSRRPSAHSSLSPDSDVETAHPDRYDLDGPTPVASPFSSEAPTRVGSPAPSIKGKEKASFPSSITGDDGDLKEKDKDVDIEKAEPAPGREEDEYPEGGLRAWMTLAGSTMVLLSTFGFSNSFGAFMPYYQTHQLSSYPASTISWIGSSHLFITFSGAFLSGIAFDRGHFQLQLALGSAGWLVGIFALSFATTFWQIFLAQSVCMGLSLGSMFSPCLSVLGTYFRRRRALVVGVAASGTALGAVVFPILLSRTFETRGFAAGVRAAGYLMLALLLLANLLTRPRVLPARPTSSPKPALSATLRKIVRDRAAWLVCSGVFCVYTCCFIPLFYVVSFAKQYGGGNELLAQYSLSIINAVAFFSRILSGLLADRTGTFTLALPFACLVGALTFAMIGCTSTGPLVAFLVLFGMAQGAWISLSAGCFMTLATDVSEMGLRSGIGFFFVALATLIGSPIAGALLKTTGGSYVAALCFGGAMAMLGVGLLWAGRREVVRRKGTSRV